MIGAGMGWAQPAPVAPPAEEPEAPTREYAGPAILSRGLGALLNPERELLRLRPFASVQGIYDTGLSGYSIDEAGQLRSVDAYGIQALFGVSGYHAWRRTVLGMQYQGRLRHYSRHTYYDGFDNFFDMSVAHQPTRRVTVVFSPAAASYSRGFFLPEHGSGFYSAELAELTEGELFDSRVNVVSAAGRLSYQRTARLSLSAGGAGFTSRRHTAALVGVTGYSAGGDVAYRVSRYQTLGADYSFAHYDFQRVFGDTDLHGIGLNYSVQMGRYWTLALRAGGHQVEISRLERVPLDPVIAAIVGQRAAITTSYRKLYHPRFDGRLARRFQRGSVSFQYARGITPGNGLYLTSAMERAGASVSYRGTRRATWFVHAATHQYRALVQDLGRYRGYSAGTGMHYSLRTGLSLSFDVGARRYEIRDSRFDRVSYRVSAGLTFSPGELPFSLW